MVYTCLLIVYMGGIYMYIDCVYEVIYTCMLILYMGGIYMYIDCVYGMVYTCLSEARTLIYTTYVTVFFVFNCLR